MIQLILTYELMRIILTGQLIRNVTKTLNEVGPGFPYGHFKMKKKKTA